MRGRILPALVAGFFVSGCTGGLTDSLAVVGRETALGVVRTANAMGVDPFQASPEALARWQAACLNLGSVATLWNPAVPGVDSAAEAFCAVVVEAAAEAPPVVPDGMPGGDSGLPAPRPRPEGGT